MTWLLFLAAVLLVAALWFWVTWTDEPEAPEPTYPQEESDA